MPPHIYRNLPVIIGYFPNVTILILLWLSVLSVRLTLFWKYTNIFFIRIAVGGRQISDLTSLKTVVEVLHGISTEAKHIHLARHLFTRKERKKRQEDGARYIGWLCCVVEACCLHFCATERSLVPAEIAFSVAWWRLSCSPFLPWLGAPEGTWAQSSACNLLALSRQPVRSILSFRFDGTYYLVLCRVARQVSFPRYWYEKPGKVTAILLLLLLL